jgi:hypothetical protein
MGAPIICALSIFVSLNDSTARCVSIDRRIEVSSQRANFSVPKRCSIAARLAPLTAGGGFVAIFQSLTSMISASRTCGT